MLNTDALVYQLRRLYQPQNYVIRAMIPAK